MIWMKVNIWGKAIKYVPQYNLEKKVLKNLDGCLKQIKHFNIKDHYKIHNIIYEYF